jgi:hypothetical protein
MTTEWTWAFAAVGNGWSWRTRPCQKVSMLLNTEATNMIHLTLNTGDSRESPRSEVEQKTIDYLVPIVAKGGGEVMDGWHLYFTDEDLPGAMFFQIASEPGFSKKPAVMCMLGFGDGAGKAWDILVQGYSVLRQNPLMAGSKPAPEEEPERPWLAVYLTPFAIGVDRDTIAMFGDMERCIAWTILEDER